MGGPVRAEHPPCFQSDGEQKQRLSPRSPIYPFAIPELSHFGFLSSCPSRTRKLAQFEPGKCKCLPPTPALKTALPLAVRRKAAHLHGPASLLSALALTWASSGGHDVNLILDALDLQMSDDLLGDLLEVIGRDAAPQDQNAVEQSAGDVLQSQIRVAA